MNLRTLIPLLFATLIFIASVGLYAGGYYFLHQYTARADNLAAMLGTDTEELANATRAHSALTSVAGSGNLDQYFITKNDIVPFLESLQTLGQPLGGTVNVISVSDQNDKAHPRIQLQLSISGSFDAVMRTLGAIEYGPYDGVISQVSLTTSTGDAKTASTAWTALATYSVGVRAATTTTP